MDQDLLEPDRALLRKYRLRVALFLLGAVLLVGLLGTLYRAINTLEYLDLVEAERDRWQRPEDVVAALKLKQGDAVADLGSGAGYFALKLSRAVGTSGRVLAVDIRRLPLVFLWIRALLGGHQNISVHLGGSDAPKLPAGALDAVLIANTYHEFANPDAMVDRTFRARVAADAWSSWIGACRPASRAKSMVILTGSLPNSSRAKSGRRDSRSFNEMTASSNAPRESVGGSSSPGRRLGRTVCGSPTRLP